MTYQTHLVTVKTEVISVQSMPESDEFWDAKKAGEVLGRSRRTVVRYIENGYLNASKVEGLNGPEWKIVPFCVSRPVETLAAPYLNKIAELEHELESLKNEQSKVVAIKDVNPGLLQTVAAFFMISSTKLGFSSLYNRTE